MPKEIERKFTIDTNQFDRPANGIRIKQGYLPMAEDTQTVARVRVKGDKGYLTVKGKNVGATRPEFEYGIPLSDAEEMLSNLCQRPIIEKERFEIQVDDHLWEVDIFFGDNEGLVIAEVELSSEEETFERPPWVLDEVTEDARYYNSNLMTHPFKDWSK